MQVLVTGVMFDTKKLRSPKVTWPEKWTRCIYLHVSATCYNPPGLHTNMFFETDLVTST